MSKNNNEQIRSEPGYHAVWSNLMFLLVTNFKLIVFFVPSLVCMYFFLMVGGLVFLTGALVLLIPAAPAVTAMYDVGYQLVRELPGYERRTFFESYKANFRQSALTMLVLLPFLELLVLLMLVAVEKPVWVTLCLMTGIFVVVSFAIYAFSQIALVGLSLKEIWNNALMLIPLMGWRGILAALVQIAALALFYNYIDAMFPFFLFLGPAVLVTWTAKTLWVKLEGILLEQPQ